MGLFFDPKPDRTQVWSCGGGTQSAWIAALICQGRLPKPDLAVMVNTERENSNVLPYVEAYIRPGLAAVGVELHIIRKSQYATVDVMSKNGKLILLPVFTNMGEDTGKLTNYCSGEWKLRVIDRWLREKDVSQCDRWVGFSLDEIRRVGTDQTKWSRTIYPLIDLRHRRTDCIAGVLNHGWPKPPRSSCWMCPNKCNAEWREMKAERPDDFAMACSFQHMILKTDPHAWLHPLCMPLELIDFESVEAREASLFGTDECPSGMCFV